MAQDNKAGNIMEKLAGNLIGIVMAMEEAAKAGDHTAENCKVCSGKDNCPMSKASTEAEEQETDNSQYESFGALN